MAPRKKAPLYDPPPWVAPPPVAYVQPPAEAPLLAEVAQLRGTVQDTYAAYKQTNGAGAEQVEQAARVLWNARQIVADLRQRCASRQHEVLPGAAYVTAAVCTGALLASRRPGYLRRLLYPTVSLVAAGGLFYPTITKQAYVELYGAVTAVDWQGGARQGWQLVRTTASRLTPDTPVPEAPGPAEDVAASVAAAAPSPAPAQAEADTGGAEGTRPDEHMGQAPGVAPEGVAVAEEVGSGPAADGPSHEGGHVALPTENWEAPGEKGAEVKAAEGGEEIPAAEDLVPAAESVMPAVEGAVPAVEGAVPAAEGVVPAVEGAVHAVEGAVPAAEGEVPAVEGAVPAVEGAVLAAEGAVPAVEGAVPAVEGAVPAAEGAVPAAEGAVPAADAGEEVPAAEGVAESREDAAVEGTEAPVAADQAPAVGPHEAAVEVAAGREAEGHEAAHVASTEEPQTGAEQHHVAEVGDTSAPGVLVLRAPADGEVVETPGDPGMSDPRDKHMYTTRG